MAEYDGLAGTPVLVEDLDAIICCDGGHGLLLLSCRIGTSRVHPWKLGQGSRRFGTASFHDLTGGRRGGQSRRSDTSGLNKRRISRAPECVVKAGRQDLWIDLCPRQAAVDDELPGVANPASALSRRRWLRGWRRHESKAGEGVVLARRGGGDRRCWHSLPQKVSGGP